MITREQFQLQVHRLCDTFGDRAFPEQRQIMIWDIVKAHAYEHVIHAIEGFIRSAKSAPLPKDFAEVMANYASKKRALGDCVPYDEATCKHCLDSGFIRVIRNETYEPWAKWQQGSSPCFCARGKELIEAGKRVKPQPIDFGPQFNENWFTSYSHLPYPEPSEITHEVPDGAA